MTASRPEGAKERIDVLIEEFVKDCGGRDWLTPGRSPRDRLRKLIAEYAREQRRGACEVCWFEAWEPIESEDECAFRHPHEGAHLRCGHCWLRAQLQTLRGENQTLEDVLADERAELAHAIEVENALTQEKAALEAALAGIRNVSDDKTRIIEALEARERALREASVETLQRFKAWIETLADTRTLQKHEFYREMCAALAPRRG